MFILPIAGSRHRSGGLFAKGARARVRLMTGLTRAGADLMLLMMRANVPNGPLLSAQTDAELALVALKFGVNLPDALKHLAVMPEPDRDGGTVADDTSFFEERLPRRLLLTPDLLLSPEKGPSAAEPSAAAPTEEQDVPAGKAVPVVRAKKKGRLRGRKAASDESHPPDDAPSDSTALKAEYSVEGPPSSRRQRPKRIHGKR